MTTPWGTATPHGASCGHSSFNIKGGFAFSCGIESLVLSHFILLSQRRFQEYYSSDSFPFLQSSPRPAFGHSHTMAENIDRGVKASEIAVETEETIENEKVDRNPETNRLAYAQNMSEEEFATIEKKIRRKLDIRLLACMWLIFVLNYLDRVCTMTCLTDLLISVLMLHRTILRQQKLLVLTRPSRFRTLNMQLQWHFCSSDTFLCKSHQTSSWQIFDLRFTFLA